MTGDKDRGRPLSLTLVTDPRYPRDRLLAAIEAAVGHGVDWVQVRDHQATTRELYELAGAAVEIARPGGARVAISDRVDLALAVGAAGVQLGQRSLSPEVARRIAPGLRIGVSVHSRNEARAAEAGGADWVTFGHIFATGSHPGEPPRGLAALAAVSRAVRIPVIAIGGINPVDLPSVVAHGAAGIAVVSAVLGAEDPARATRELRQQLDDARARALNA